MEKLRSKAILQNLNLPKSCRVTITVANEENSTFTGVVHSVDQTVGKITLKNVSTEGAKLYGLQIYFCKDILDMQVLSDVQEGSDLFDGNLKNKRSKDANFPKKTQPAHLSRLRNLNDDSLILSNILRDELGDQGIGSEEDEFEDFYDTDKYTLICRVCDKFYEAIEYIMGQETVGVVVDGQKLGRDGTLSLLQIVTDCELIIFDILRLGDEAFKCGLQAVFESEDVMKVIHDCRWLSDLLKHQHKIFMANVFDTQVANAFVYRSKNEGDWPRFVESLQGLLISYLNLPAQDVQFTQVRERCKEKDEAVWLVRPMPEKLLEAATKNTVHLLRLQHALLIEMLAEFRAGVGIYLNHVSGTVEDVEKCRVNSNLLPIAFTYIDEFVREKPSRRERQDPQCSYRKGFRENNINIPSSVVVFSHDSPWHRSHHSHPKGPTLPGTSNLENGSTLGGVPAEEKGKSRIMRRAEQLRSPSKSKPETGHKDSFTVTDKRKTLNNNKNMEVTASCSAEFSDFNKTPNHIIKNDVVQNHCCNKKESPADSNFSDTPSHHMATLESVSTHKTSSVKSSQPAGGIQNSRLWKMMNQNKKHSFESLVSSQEEHAPEPAISQMNPNQTPPTPEKTPTSDVNADDEEDAEAKELKRQMALLDQLHFVPATVGSGNRIPTIPSKLSSSHLSDSSSSSLSSEHRRMPQLIKESQLCPSQGSSDSDRPRILFKPSEVDMIKEQNFTLSALMPAGMQETKQRAKKKGHGSNIDKEAVKVTQAAPRPSAGDDLDFSLIPTPQSLSLRKEHPLGMSPIGIGNPFSEDEGFCTPSNLRKPGLVSSQFAKEDSISDVELDMLLKSDKSQKILKLASSKPSTNVKDKILPLPARAFSRHCVNS